MNDPVVPLSASRIKTAQSCSWLYHCKYVLSLPDASNDGARRGSICHLIFEVLGNKRHKKKHDTIIKKDDVASVKSVDRLILKHAKSLGVDDDENLDLIRVMTLNGLKYDFFGKGVGKPTEALSEQSFEIVFNEGGKRYKIKGFIDKLFLYKGQKYALIRDFKSSKQVFKGKEITDNLQDYMYSLAVKHLYPHYTERQSEFLFLKFELKEDVSQEKIGRKKPEPSGLVRMAPITPDDLEGFEYQLTAIQEYLDGFNLDDAKSNFAASQPFPTDNSFSGPLQCGFAKEKGQLKKDGTPMWHCPMKFDFDYFVILNKDKKVIKSYTEKKFSKDLIPKGCSFEKRHYDGCPKFLKRY